MKVLVFLPLGVVLILGGVVWIFGGFQEFAQVQGRIVSGRVQTVCAPYSGEIERITVLPGQIVIPGEVLFQMSADSLWERQKLLKRRLVQTQEEGAYLTALIQLRRRAGEIQGRLLGLEAQEDLRLPDLFSPGERDRRSLRRDFTASMDRIGLLELELRAADLQGKTQDLLGELDLLLVQTRQAKVTAATGGKAEFFYRTGGEAMKPGVFLPQGTPVVQISDPDDLLVEAPLPLVYQGRFSLGSPVVVRDLRDSFLKPLPLRILEIGPPDSKGFFLIKAGPVPGPMDLGVPMEVRISLKERLW